MTDALGLCASALGKIVPAAIPTFKLALRSAEFGQNKDPFLRFAA